MLTPHTYDTTLLQTQINPGLYVNCRVSEGTVMIASVDCKNLGSVKVTNLEDLNKLINVLHETKSLLEGKSEAQG